MTVIALHGRPAVKTERNEVIMIPVIDKEGTGRQIRKYMKLRGFSVQDVKAYLSLGCVQSVYHWLDGQCLPSLDNLYALSEMLKVPMDRLVVGNSCFHRKAGREIFADHLLIYFQQIREHAAA